MRKIVFSLIAVLCAGFVSAQNVQVTGIATAADDNSPMIGVAVAVEGTAGGTITDIDGAYSISAPSNGTLVFSFMGYETLTVPVEGRKVINVTLTPGSIVVDDVVITATGLKRSEKALGYASSTIKSDEIVRAHAADALSGMAGKVAGLQISSSGGTGTSQKVVIRGYSSLTGSNQPLYVIDGVPMSNSIHGTQDLNNSIDFGNSAADINPEDIESITVLKGASATALYGSRAGNGAILITTKRGQQNEKVSVTYDGTFQASTVLRIPQLQNKFGQGWYYSDYGYLFENYAMAENGSWGNLLDGRTVEWRPGANWYAGAEPSYTDFSYKENSLSNFYSTGFEANNNITISGGSKNSGFVATYGNISSNGILPGTNDYYKRNNFSFRGNTKLFKERGWINYSLTYVNKKVRNGMTGQGGSGSVIYQDILQYPVNLDYADMKDYNSIYNNADNFYTPYAQNPWWILDHNYATYEDDRVYGNAEFGIDIIKGLQFITRGGLDVTNYRESYYNDLWTFSPGSWTEDMGGSPENGSFDEVSGVSKQYDVNFLLNADYKLGKDFSLHGGAGFNMYERNGYALSGTLSGLAVGNWASFSNTSGAVPEAGSSLSKRRLVGLYAQADLGFRDAAYLTFSARNDWSSTLPKNDNSFFYWGVNGSVILTDLIPNMQNNVLNFLKIRGGYGKTGNDAGTYLTSSYYYLASASGGFGNLTFPLNGFAGLRKSSRIPATELKPEISTEAEVGIDARFFDSRLTIDLAYYSKETTNQIMTATLPYESGYTSAVRNVGSIKNKGIELTVGVVPVRTRNFEWNMLYTFTKNNNTVGALWDDVTEYNIYGLSKGPQLVAEVGEPMGVWKDYKICKVEDESSPYNGMTIVNAQTGFPTYDATQTEILGKADADFTMGLTNNFRYKDFSLSFGLDWRHGGLMYSATSSIVYFNGNAEATMYNLRDPWVEPNAVYMGADGQYHENNIPVNNYPGYNMNGEWYDNYNYVRYRDCLIDKSYLKLRELSLTYNIPSKVMSKIKWLQAAQISFVGRNLLMWTPNQGIIDPDMTNYGNDLDSQYGEYYSSPSTRTMGGNIKLVF
ncbi:MAG: SusC/RagA family TonB-linked outer membrane protein [Bacteroidaceae bacterium]|nr:SusC/RagA family TonB-linked outer membrane protein [Bacteroidaceae bacterium]